MYQYRKKNDILSDTILITLGETISSQIAFLEQKPEHRPSSHHPSSTTWTSTTHYSLKDSDDMDDKKNLQLVGVTLL